MNNEAHIANNSKLYDKIWNPIIRNDDGSITIDWVKLKKPLSWRNRCTVSVCTKIDLFYEDVPDEIIDQVFGLILACYVLGNIAEHTFIILTKRPDRMHKFLNGQRTPSELIKAWSHAADAFVRMDDEDEYFHEEVSCLCSYDWTHAKYDHRIKVIPIGAERKPWEYTDRFFPLPNVWLGVTAENQAQADKRIPYLLLTPATKRFISIEPMLDNIDMKRILVKKSDAPERGKPDITIDVLKGWFGGFNYNERTKLDWVIVGGESDPNARPMKKEWVLNIKRQCDEQGVPFFFKQWGTYGEDGVKRNKKANGCLLDGKEYRAMSEGSYE